MRDRISIWSSKKEQRWIFQVSYVDAAGKRQRIQRRAKSKSEASTRALDLARSPQLNSLVVEAKCLDDLIVVYTATMKHQVRPSTLATSVQLLKLYVSPVFGREEIRTIGVSEVSDLLNKLRESDPSVATAHTIRAKFYALMQFALVQGRIDLNPVSRVKPLKSLPGHKTQVKDPWSISEVRSVLQAFSGLFLEVFMLVALTTGMRKGEILGLQRKDVDFRHRQIRVQKSLVGRRILNSDQSISLSNELGPTKTKSSTRVLPLTSRLSEHLLALRGLREARGISAGPKDYLVLGANGEPISPSYMRKLISKHLKANNTRRIRIHDTRHTVVVLALEDVVPLEEVSQGLGHSGVEITKRIYAPSVQGLSDRFVNRMD